MDENAVKANNKKEKESTSDQRRKVSYRFDLI